MMQRFGWVLSLLVLGALSWANAANENAVVEARILEDLKFLAGEECEGRGVTTKGINVAADHIAKEFKKNNLKSANPDGSYFQHFKMGGSAKLEGGAEANQLQLTGPQGQSLTLELGKDFNVLGTGGAGKVSAPVVFVGHGITSKDLNYDDYANADIAGKVVVVLRRTPPSVPFQNATNLNQLASLQNKAGNAEAHKAAAVLFVNDNTLAADSKDELMSFEGRGRESITIPMAHVRRSFVNGMIQSAFGQDLSTVEKAIEHDGKSASRTLPGWTCSILTNVVRQQTPVKNVIGVLEGAGPLKDETVVLGAHYDHLGFGGSGSLARGTQSIHFGADDNASGTSCLIEVARRFGTMPNRQGRRLVFMAFSAEESGLLGSAHYAKNPILPLDKTVAMINMDMVGRLREDKLTLGGVGTAKTFEALVDKLNEKHKFALQKDKTGMGPSDHQSFYKEKVPVFFFFTGMHQQYHRPTDTVDTINVQGIRKIADFVEELAATLATDEQRPEYVFVPGVFNPNRDSGRSSGPRMGIMPGNYQDADGGVLVEDVTDNGPAKKAGILKNDRIIDIGGKPVKNITAYMSVMGGFKRGDKVEITVIRDKKEQKLTVSLE